MALKDPTANQIGGVSASLVAIDTQYVYDSLPAGYALNTTVTAPRLGGGTYQLEDPRYPGKALRFQQAAGAVADGDVVANTYLNRTGKALVTGNIVLAVAP